MVILALLAIAALKLCAAYLKTTFPASSTFHALIKATSPLMASSIKYCLPLNSRTSRLEGYLTACKENGKGEIGVQFSLVKPPA